MKRKIWLYNQENYDLYRQKLSEVNWEDLLNEDDSVNIMADKIADKMLEIGSLTIPNRIITVRQNELPWITNDIRRLTRVIQKVLLCTKYYVISNAYPYLVYSNRFRKVS